MFVDLVDGIEHHDPWVLPWDVRFARLVRGDLRIAYLYERADNSTFRYRIYNMTETIRAQWPEASASYFFLDDGVLLDKVADQADILVVCRTRYGEVANRLVTRARRRGIPIVFDIDDMVFDIRFVHLLMYSLNQGTSEAELDFWFAMVGRMGKMLRLCDRAITTNAFLADKISRFADFETAVVPNFMNEAQLTYSEMIWNAKQTNGFARDGTLHIGYFSGSPTHTKDFALTESALAAILKRFPETRIRMVGYLEPAGPLLDHLDRIDREPFRDYVNLQRLIGSTEINIAPLQDNRFTNCKSELKYFEAAITGTNTIASPNHSFSAAIRPGDNGQLSAAHEWAEKISEMVLQLQDRPDDYAAMARRAEADARKKYDWRNQIGAIRNALAL